MSSTIKAAQITDFSLPPHFATLPAPPTPSTNETQIKVHAVGLHSLVRARANGTHYSVANKPLPQVPGVDGTGYAQPSGNPVFFTAFGPGTMMEVVNVPKSDVTPIPAGADLSAVAAWFNPAMSSWMALRRRVRFTEAQKSSGFSILILGATSASGKLAIRIARKLGATRVVGAARSEKGLAALGLDETVVLKDVVSETDYSKMGHVDVILDYIYGDAAVHMFKSLPALTPLIQYVQLGSLGGSMEIPLSGSILRGKNIALLGSGPGSWTTPELSEETPAIVEALGEGMLDGFGAHEAKIEDVEEEWKAKRADRVVFTF